MKPTITDFDKAVPKWIMDCPISANWVEFKGETYFAMLNYKRSIKAGRPMIDLFYCATEGLNYNVLKTVQYSKTNFKKSKLDVEDHYYHKSQALEKENSDLRAQLRRVKKGELRLEKIKKRLIERFRVEEGDEEWDSISFFAIREIIEQEFTTSSPSKAKN